MSQASQDLELVCCRCGDQGVYSVGTVSLDLDAAGEPTLEHISFSAYFRCRKCGGPGPWDVVDVSPIVRQVHARARGEKVPGLTMGRKAMIEGVFIQTPALAEEALIQGVEKEPQNAALHTALGGVLRRAGLWSRAQAAYEQAIVADPHAFEARLVLLFLARQAADHAAAATHASLLVHGFLTGHKPPDAEAAEDLAMKITAIVRSSSGAFREHLLDPLGAAATPEVRAFTEWLLDQHGDEEKIAAEAIGCLLRGEAGPPDAFVPGPLDTEPKNFPVDLVPSLGEAAEASKLKSADLRVVLLRDKQGGIRIADRAIIPIADRESMMEWAAPPLTQLFRGDRQPPQDMDHYPEAYVPHFFFIERHLITLFDSLGARTDQEMEEVFAALRRRPDGRSLNRTHDFVWQVCALLLGSHVVSAAEFEALLGALVRSARRWAQQPISRNYAAFITNKNT